MATETEGRVKEVIVDSRINKVLAMRTDSVAMLEALDAISEFYVSNTIEARRALRQDLELHNINLGKKFLAEFDQVRQKIEGVEEFSLKLEGECKLLASRVSEADENMKAFMEKASELENRRNNYTEQSKEIGTFLSRFQLSSDEVDTLNSAPIDNPNSARTFFDSLRRLRVAYTDCKLMVEKHSYSAGFELLDVLGQHQDMAYQRLFEWVKGKCDSLADSGSTEDIDQMMQTAISYLRRLPIYFSQCQDLVVNSRRSQLVQKFVVALTQGGPSGQVFRAMDLHAHDSVRYVGDMLAWMHQAVASEEEFLEAVFGEPSSKRSTKVETDDVDGGGGVSTSVTATGSMDNLSTSTKGIEKELVGLSVQELLARCLQGLGRPLRVRIIQTLESRTGVEVLYALTDLLSFYEQTFTRIIPIENAVHSAVKGCHLECRRLFISGLNKQSDALQHTPLAYPLDLTAAHSTKECCRQIQEVLRVQSSAMSTQSDDPADSCHVDTVLGSVIQPLLQACRMGGQALSKGDMALFMLNNVSAIRSVLIEASKRNELMANKSTVSNSWFELLNTEAATWVDVLATEEVNRTLRRSDLDKLLEILEVIPVGIVASQQQGLGQDRVGTVMRAFYASLFSTMTPHFERLQDLELRETTRRSTAEAVASAHEKIHKLISIESHGYDRASLLAHTVDEVRVLLGCA